jgi:hypothetical protein
MRHIFVVTLALLFAGMADAQVRVSINFNVDRQPIWGPTGYDRVEYYYLPDIGVYYNVPQRKFYYSEDGSWVGRSSLPSRYRGYDLYNSYKVVVNEKTPYRNDAKYKQQYASYKDRHDQEAIRDSRDAKYFANADHPEHRNWKKQQQQGNGNDKETKHGNGPGRK